MNKVISTLLVMAVLAIQAIAQPPQSSSFLDRWSDLRQDYYGSVPEARELAYSALGELYLDIVDSVSAKDEGPTRDECGALFYVASVMAREPEGLFLSDVTRMEALEVALEVGLAYGEDTITVSLYAELVKYCHKENRIDDALDYFDLGYELRDSFPSAHFALCIERSAIERRQGRGKQALRWLIEAEAVAKSPSQQCEVLGEYVTLYTRQGLLDLAARKSAQQWELIQQNPTISTTVQAGAQLHRLISFIDLGRLNEAIDFARGIIEDSSSPDTAVIAPHLEPKVLRLLATALWEQGDAKSIQEASRVLEGLQDHPSQTPFDRVLSLCLLCRIYLETSRPEEASKIVTSLRELDESGFDSPDQGSPTQYRIILRAFELKVARARNEITPSQYLESLEEAFESLHLWLEENLPIRPGGIGAFRQSQRRDMLEDMFDAIHEALPPDQAHTEMLDVVARAQSLGTVARILKSPAQSAQDIQAGLPKNRAAIVFVNIAKSLWILGVSKDEVIGHRLGEIDSLQALVNLWYESLSSTAASATSDLWKSVGNKVRDTALPSPFPQWLESFDELVVVGAHEVDWLPMESIPWGESILGIEKAITHVPSLALIRSDAPSAQKAPNADRDPLGIIHVSTFTEAQKERWGVVDLPLSDELARELSTPFPPERVNLYQDQSWTFEGMGAETEMPSILHWITHGVYDPDREQPSGLLLFANEQELEPKEVLWCQDMHDVFSTLGAPKPQLMILSACGAALGPQRIGDDGISHLGGTLLASGVPCIALSSVELDYYATLKLVSLVQDQLALGNTIAESFRLARKAFWTDERWSHPYYHGLMRVLGAGFVAPIPRRDSPAFDAKSTTSDSANDRPSPRLVWGLIALVFMGVAGVWILTRRAHRLP